MSTPSSPSSPTEFSRSFKPVNSSLMAKFNSLILFVLVSLLVVLQTNADEIQESDSLKRCKLDKIYNFGDSLSDTGNLIRESVIGSRTQYARPPYGRSMSRNSTGRCSDGRLMIDFLASSAGLPMLRPYKERNANFEHGVNFAVAGSTALRVETLKAVHILCVTTTSSLNIQLDWMHSYFNSTCHSECKQKNVNSLFMVGEIGGNDYNYGFLQGRSIQELENITPQIVATISKAVKEVIDVGATRVVVPGNIPLGCLPIYLTLFQTNDTTGYDKFHCLKNMNKFSKYHNKHLRKAVRELKIQHPNISIVYGDYYKAFMWVYSRAQSFGFDMKSIQKSCCGTGGVYNFKQTKMCGARDATVCPNPSQYFHWDGLHLTQHTYQLMAGWLIRNLSKKLQCHI